MGNITASTDTTEPINLAINMVIQHIEEGEKCCPPKDFDGTEEKYKTWLRLLETNIRAYNNIFPDDNHRINFALSYMSLGKARDWANHFMETHKNANRVFTLNMTWAEFVKELDKTFNSQKTRDKAQTNLVHLKHKPGQLEQYILHFNTFTSQAGYRNRDEENPLLSQLFLQHLNPALCYKITTQKKPPKTLEEIIDDARDFDKSYQLTQAWKQGSRLSRCQGGQ